MQKRVCQILQQDFFSGLPRGDTTVYRASGVKELVIFGIVSDLKNWTSKLSEFTPLNRSIQFNTVTWIYQESIYS